MKRLFDTLLRFTVLGLFVATVGGFAGGRHWTLDLLAHFRVQYLLGTVLLLPVLMLRERRGVHMGLLLAAFLLNGWQIAPYYVPIAVASASTPQTETLRVITLNINSDNHAFDTILKSIRDSNADVVAIIEVSPQFEQELNNVADRYPFQFVETFSNDHFGIALISRVPMQNQEVLFLGDMEAPTLSAEIIHDNALLTVIATHPSPPFFDYGTRNRDSLLAELAPVINDNPHTTVVMGDLNATPWSVGFRNLINTTDLQDSARGYGLQPTWLTASYPFGIAIDHVLISEELTPISRTVGNGINSDHFPVIVEISR